MIILGDGTVGKTSFSLRVTQDKFIDQYKQTVGVDFFLKNVALPGTKSFLKFKTLLLRFCNLEYGENPYEHTSLCGSI